MYSGEGGDVITVQVCGITEGPWRNLEASRKPQIQLHSQPCLQGSSPRRVSAETGDGGEGRGTGDGGESQLSSVLTGSAVDRNTTVLQVHCPLCPLTGPLTSSFLQRLTERQHEEQISTLGGDLQIFEVFQVFKSPPGDASYVVVVEKSVEKRDVAVRRRADQDKYPGVNSLQQFHKNPPPPKKPTKILCPINSDVGHVAVV